MASDSNSSDDFKRIDELCDQFEKEFRTGNQPRIETYLEQVPEALRARLREELELLIDEIGGATKDTLQGPSRKYSTIFQGPTELTDPPVSIQDRFRIVRKLGAGGMGAVYLAEQTQPVRRMVAVKVIKKGMDSEQVIARFEAERQALAMMEHPNIARVLDAGITEDGQPFFAMEYVDGVPLTEYCDVNTLDLRGRLALFVQVCNAVQHAHQKGIIHRDLKPSNILVAKYDSTPTVKVIDFGLAKATQGNLTNRTLFTAMGQVLGTLAYMSPEQSEGKAIDIDTRTDVYSLGVILYELLTGSTPLSKQRLREEGVDLILRLIREEEAPKPSLRLIESEDSISITERRSTDPKQLSSVLRGDLDWIVMKALEKDRDRRYPSISALGDDVARFLKHEPVEARPPSFAYRFRKAARKYRRIFLTAACMLALLILGLVGTITGWVSAARHARISELRRVFDTDLLDKRRPAGSLSLDDTRALLEVSDSLELLDRQQADDARRRVLGALADSLLSRISAQRISEQQVLRLKADIDQLDELHGEYGAHLATKQMDDLQLALSRRSRDWFKVLEMNQPRTLQDVEPLDSQGVMISGRDYEMGQEARSVLLSAQAEPNNMRLNVTFVRGLNETNWIGLSLNEKSDGTHYRFVLSTQELVEEESRSSKMPTVRADTSDPDDNLLAAISRQKTLWMSLIRSGRLLAQRTISLSEPTIRLTAQREQDQLRFIVNGNEPLIFDDAFPIPHAAGAGPSILWPQGVAVSAIEVQRQKLDSANPSRVEQADVLFAEENYEQAEQVYAQVDSLEAIYKRGVCLKYLGRLGSKELFEEVAANVPANALNGRWHLLATLQLLEITSSSDVVGYQRAIDEIVGLYGHQLEYVLRVAPRQLQQELLRFLQKDGTRWRIAYRTRGDIPELELAVDFQERNGTDPVRLRATKWRLADALRIDGQATAAAQRLDQLILETEPDREVSREYAALVSDRCWIDFANAQTDVAEKRLESILESVGGQLPQHMAYVLVEVARLKAIQGKYEEGEGVINQYFDLATPESASHGEYVDAALVGGLIQSKLGKPDSALQVWQRGLRRKWMGGLQELEDRNSAYGLALVDAQKSIDGEAFLEPLAQEKSTDEIWRGITLDLEESGLRADYLPGLAKFFFVDEIMRNVVDGLFDFPGGTEVLEKIILHRVTLREQCRLPLVGILFEGVRNRAFADEVLTEEYVIAGRAICAELIDHYDDERIDPSRHFWMIAQAFLGKMSDDTWVELQQVLSSRVCSGVALVNAQVVSQRWFFKDDDRVRLFLRFVIENEQTPAPLREFAEAKLQAMAAASN